MGLGSSAPGGTTGGQSNGGNNSSQGDSEGSQGRNASRTRGGRVVKKAKAKTLLWKFKDAQTHFVEGHEPEKRYSGDPNISVSEHKKRTKDVAAQQEKWNAEFAMRQKIKPITDPDANNVESRKRAVRRKQKGRTGTLLSETLG